MKLTDLLIFVKPPQTRPAIINTASRDLLAAGIPSAVEKISLSWSRPSGYAHQSAGTMSARLVGDRHLIELLAWDSRIDLLAVIEGDPAPWRTLFIGWITQTARRRRADGLFDITASATNIIGRAAGTRLGARPWPVQSITARLTAINAASPVGPLAAVEAPAWDRQPRAALDVDSRAALDVIEATVDPTVTLEEGADGLIHSVVSVGSRVAWPTPTSELTVAGTLPQAIQLPADAVIDAARVANRTGLITHVSIEAKSLSPDDHPGPGELPKYEPHSKTWRNGALGRQSAEHKITTDAIAEATRPMPKQWEKYAQGLTTQGEHPGERLEACELIPARLEPLTAGQLVGIDTRAGIYIEIESAPDDVEPAQRITTGRLDIQAAASNEGHSGIAGLRFNQIPTPAPKRLEDWSIPIDSGRTMKGAKIGLELDLEPTRLSGVTPLAFAEVPNDAYNTFSRAGQTTIAQLCYVNRIAEAPAATYHASRRFLTIATGARFNQTSATIAQYAYLEK